MSNYTTQMDAARKGIVTPEIENGSRRKSRCRCRQADGAGCRAER